MRLQFGVSLLFALTLALAASCSSAPQSPDAGVADVSIEEDIWLPDAYIHDTVPDDLGACKVPNPNYFPFVEVYKGDESIQLMRTFADGKAMVFSSDRMMIIGQTVEKEVRFPDEELLTAAVRSGDEVVTANHRGQIKIYDAALELQRTIPLVATELCQRSLVLRSGHLLCSDNGSASPVVVYDLASGAVVSQGSAPIGLEGTLVQIDGQHVIGYGSRPMALTINSSHEVSLLCESMRPALTGAAFFDRQEGALLDRHGAYHAPLGSYCSTILDNDYFLPTGTTATFHNPSASPTETIVNVAEHEDLLVLWLLIGEDKGDASTYLFRLMRRSTNAVLAEAKVSNIPYFRGHIVYNETCNYALVTYGDGYQHLGRVYFD